MDLAINSRTSGQTSLRGCDGIRLDVTSNCNLRCPYCINDFTQIHGNVFITPEIFDRAMTLLPLLRDGGDLLVSCYFEPTLHPHFLDLVDRMPAQYRARAGFTTNLSRRLGDDFFERLSRSGIGYVNVSIDSLDPAIFEEMRKGCHFDVFRDNLNRLANAFSNQPAAPKLNFISVLSKRNLEEIPELVAQCSRLYAPALHELRVIWLTQEIEQRSWIVEQALTVDGFLKLRQLQPRLPAHAVVTSDLPSNWESRSPFPSRKDPNQLNSSTQSEDEAARRLRLPAMDPILRITSDGKVGFLLSEPEFRLDLNQLADPLETVGQALFLQNLSVGRARLLEEATERARETERVNQLNQWLADGRLELVSRRSAPPLGNLDDVRIAENDGRLGAAYHVGGWARDPEKARPAAEVALIASRRRARRIVAVKRPNLERADVALALSDARLLYTGWAADLDAETLAGAILGPFTLAAYALGEDGRKAHKLAGEREVKA